MTTQTRPPARRRPRGIYARERSLQHPLGAKGRNLPEYLVRQRAAGLSWSLIHRGQPVMTMESGQRKKPSVTTIRNAYRLRDGRAEELPLLKDGALQKTGSEKRLSQQS